MAGCALAFGIDPTLDALIEQIVDLSDFAWLFRYPGDPNEPAPTEAASVLRRAITVVDRLSLRVREHLRPREYPPRQTA